MPVHVRRFLAALAVSACALVLHAGEAAPPKKGPPVAPKPAGPKRIPPEGVAIPGADRDELQAGLRTFEQALKDLPAKLQGKPQLLALLPDVEVYFNALHAVLTYNEFFDPKEVAKAKSVLKNGLARAEALARGEHPWTSAKGLVVRGYRSKLDDTAIPYGLVIPETFDPASATPYRLDVWLHGRDEKLSELNFIDQREKSAGEFTPPNTLVLHAYGRYCNAYKFAGEVDVFEGLAHARANYPVDPRRIAIRGFSMGGGGCWHLSVHHPAVWAAAAPGAGFSETPEFSRAFQQVPPPEPWEVTLWNLYDATPYAVNLFNVPTVAYSGEKDRQIQAAQMMEKALQAEGMELVHIIGPGTEHKYHPEAKTEINRRIDEHMAKGQAFFTPLKFTTFTLRYNRARWMTVDALDKHWSRARLEASLTPEGLIRVKAENIAALSIDAPAGTAPAAPGTAWKVNINGQDAGSVTVAPDKSAKASFVRVADRWSAGTLPATPRKIHGRQGPIDDAFMDSFIFVEPTAKGLNEAIDSFVQKEFKRAVAMWRSQFRGNVRIVKDTALTPEQIQAHNLILWGDPRSNAVIAKIAEKLPIQWSATAVQLGAESFAPEHHVPVFIAPNPLNPNKYVVLNSSFTFREEAMASNARQNAKLPDFAIVDITTAPTDKFPGKIARAGFFNEEWIWRGE